MEMNVILYSISNIIECSIRWKETQKQPNTLAVQLMSMKANKLQKIPTEVGENKQIESIFQRMSPAGQ